MTPSPLRAQKISDGGFEDANAGNPEWTFSGLSGYSPNSIGTVFTSGNASAPEGVEVAYIQSNGSSVGSISQTISGFQPNTQYLIAFWAAGGVSSAGQQTLQITMQDGGDTHNLGTFPMPVGNPAYSP